MTAEDATCHYSTDVRYYLSPTLHVVVGGSQLCVARDKG